METRAVLRGVRLSVDKGRLVADLIRGKKVDQALNILEFTQKKAAYRICLSYSPSIAAAWSAPTARPTTAPLTFPTLPASPTWW